MRLTSELPRPPEERSNTAGLLLTDAKLAKVPLNVLYLHRIIADFSKAKVPENYGVTLIQVMQMTALCLEKTLGIQHEKPIKITWLSPDGVSLAKAGLPLEIKKPENKAEMATPRKPSD